MPAQWWKTTTSCSSRPIAVTSGGPRPSLIQGQSRSGGVSSVRALTIPNALYAPSRDFNAYTLYSPVRAGIPYASPPVDGLRWKAPEDVTCWDGVLDGSAYGDQCIQQSPWSSVGGGDGQEVVGNEDCLYLNVFAPDGWATRSAMPVVVWIHGGSLVRVSSHRASHVPRPTSHLLLRPTSHLTSPASASPRSRLPSGRCP